MNSILNLMNVLIYTGVFVYFISRLTPIPYSEYYCYGTIMLAIFVSMVVMLGISTKNVKEIGIIQMVIRLFKTCTPGILIIIQLLSLIVLFTINSGKIYESKMPPMFSIFNQYVPNVMTRKNVVVQKKIDMRRRVKDILEWKG